MGQSLFSRFANTVLTLILLYYIHIFCKAYICMKNFVDCSCQMKVKEISEKIPNYKSGNPILNFFHVFHNYKETITIDCNSWAKKRTCHCICLPAWDDHTCLAWEWLSEFLGIFHPTHTESLSQTNDYGKDEIYWYCTCALNKSGMSRIIIAKLYNHHSTTQINISNFGCQAAIVNNSVVVPG